MRRISLLLTIAALVCGGAAQAQNGPWTLLDCINYALEHNLSVQQSELTVEQREIEWS